VKHNGLANNVTLKTKRNSLPNRGWEQINIFTTWAFYGQLNMLENVYFQNWLKTTESKNVIHLVDPIPSNEYGKTLFYTNVPAMEPKMTTKDRISKATQHFDLCLTYECQDAIDFGFLYQEFPIDIDYLNETNRKLLQTGMLQTTPKFDITLITGITHPEKRQAIMPLLKLLSHNPQIKSGILLSPSHIDFDSQGNSTDGRFSNIDANLINELVNLTNEPSSTPGGNFVNRILNTKTCCIITTGNYLTVGHLEAFYFGKKMITNVKLIEDHPCFNEKLVRVVDFDNISEEDLLWAVSDYPTSKDGAIETYPNKEYVGLEKYIERIQGMLYK
jgi:hypothetical protein